MTFVPDVKSHMESQDLFNGWAKFGHTWDVDDKSPLVVVSRQSSLQSDWNNVVAKNAKELVVVEKKFGFTRKVKVADAESIDGK